MQFEQEEFPSLFLSLLFFFNKIVRILYWNTIEISKLMYYIYLRIIKFADLLIYLFNKLKLYFTI